MKKLNLTQIYPVVFSSTKENFSHSPPAYLYVAHYDLVKNDLESFTNFIKSRKWNDIR